MREVAAIASVKQTFKIKLIIDDFSDWFIFSQSFSMGGFPYPHVCLSICLLRDERVS